MADILLPHLSFSSAPSSPHDEVAEDFNLPGDLAEMEPGRLPLERVSFRTPRLSLADMGEELRERALAGFARMARCFYPSLPRVFEHQMEGATLRLLQSQPGGEPIDAYLQRLGPIMLETACALVWRLATELTHAQRLFPDLPGWLDPKEARLHLWHRDCLLLTLPSFAARPSSGEEPAGEPQLVKDLVTLLGKLIGAGQGSELPPHLARRLPTEVLRLFLNRAPSGGTPNADQVQTVAEFQKQMLQAIFLMSRRKDSACLDALFRVPSRLYPRHSDRSAYLAPAASEVLPDSGRTAVSLIQLLGHRGRLRAGEIRVLQKAIERALKASPRQEVCLDPLNLYLQFNLNGGSLDQRKDLLDTRLQADSGIKVHLHAPDPAFDLLSSPVMVSPARKANQPCALHLNDPTAQLSRLFDVLRSGCYSISAFSDTEASFRVRTAASRHHRKPQPGQVASILAQIADAPPAAVLVNEQQSFPSPVDALEIGSSNATPQESRASETLDLAQALPLDTVSPSPTAQSQPSSMDSYSADDTFKPQPESANRLVIMTVGSGGIGKSTIARLLYELTGLSDAGNIALFDCDATGNRDFQRVAPDRVEATPVHDVETIRKMISASMENPLVIADLPASCHDLVLRDLNPDIVTELRLEDGIQVIPVFPVTAKASTIPAIHQWRKLIFGDAAAVLVVNLKDGPVTNDMIQKVQREGDTVLRMPLLDTALASALDTIGGLWTDICEGRTGQDEKLFTNPLVRRQLRTKIREMETVFAPLIQRMKSVCQKN